MQLRAPRARECRARQCGFQPGRYQVQAWHELHALGMLTVEQSYILDIWGDGRCIRVMSSINPDSVSADKYSP